MSIFHRENILLASLLFIPCVYLGRRLYKTFKTLQKQLADEELFWKRHNCVVMYSRNHMRGWHPFEIEINTSNLNQSLEPQLYFIATAKQKLDIAVMTFNIPQMINALCDAVKRGVKVRLIVNFLSVKPRNKDYIKLLKMGVKIAFYVDKSEKMNFIMHSKYMVKDCTNDEGFLCMGSMNFTSLSSVLSNYEDVVFTSNFHLVRQFQDNFEHSWNLINEDNRNLYNATVLNNAGFLQFVYSVV